MDKEFIKEIIINILENEKQIYMMIKEERKDDYISTIPKTIELLEKHVKSGFYDIQLEAICDFLLKEKANKNEKLQEKENKQKGKKKSE